MTCADSLSAISLPESEYGLSPCGKLDGRTTAPSGPDRALASLSARQARALGLLTSGTYGPLSFTSLTHVDLSWRLASRLQARTQTLGSTLYKLTWRPWITPSGLYRFRLRASVLRTSATELTGWVSPQASDARGSGKNQNTASLCKQTKALAGWGTPTANTPGGTPEQALKRKEAADCGQSVTCLAHQVQMVGPARLTASGQMLTGSSAGMESGGQLNPAHSLWLMLGCFATAWASCGGRVTRSRSDKRKPSSRRS